MYDDDADDRRGERGDEKGKQIEILLICSQCGRLKLRKICTTRTELLNWYIFYTNFYCKSHATDWSPSSTTTSRPTQHHWTDQENDYSPQKKKTFFLWRLVFDDSVEKSRKNKGERAGKNDPNGLNLFLFRCFSRATRESESGGSLSRMQCERAHLIIFHVDWLLLPWHLRRN